MSWDEALDRYEAALDAHDAALSAEVEVGEVPWPPSELPVGPVPAHARRRAELLLARSRALGDRVRTRRDAIPKSTAGGRRPLRPRGASTAASSWLDASL